MNNAGFKRTAKILLLSFVCLLAKHGYAGADGIKNKIPESVLWMYTSGEYKALCLQIYKNALDVITVKVKRRKPGDQGKKPAVVMDLDETVLTNIRYNLSLAAKGIKHSEDRWEDWIKNHPEEVFLVPGALEFIKRVREQRVEVVFISNRLENQKEITFNTLKRLKVFPAGAQLGQFKDRLLLRKSRNKKDKSKAERRRGVNEFFSVIAWLGDNLADFAQEFEASGSSSYENRNKRIQSHTVEWGTRWFVFPNPVYGDWKSILKHPLTRTIKLD